MDRRYSCQHNQRVKCAHGNQCSHLSNQVGPINQPPPGQWWDSVLTPPLSATSSQSGSSCSRFLEKHATPCTDGCNKLLNTQIPLPHENRFVWDRTPYDKLCYDTRHHPSNEPPRCHHHPGDVGPHHGDMVARHPPPCCHQPDYEVYTRHHCCRPHPPVQPKPKGCCSRPKPAGCDCGSDRVYSSARHKKQQPCTCKNCARSPSPLLLSTPNPRLNLNQSSMRSLVPLTLHSPESSTPAQLHFPQLNYMSNNGRTRAFSSEAVLSTSTDNRSSDSEQPDTKNAVTSPTMPPEVQSDQISSTTPTDEEDRSSGIFPDGEKPGTTVNRATSPFIVKMATQVEQLPNDPAVRSLVKSIVMFNDVEYQVPTKIIRRSKSQEFVHEEKENIYWEIEDTPLKPPQQTCLSFFCTPRRKEQRNVSADSVGSITPLLKCKKSGGFFKLGRSSKSKQQTSCLNSRVLRGVMSRKTADNITSVQTGVSRVKIFNASSERYEAPQGRHTVAIPSTSDTNQAAGSSQRDTEKIKPSGKQSKSSALGRLFGKRKSEGGVRWKINPEYYMVRDGSGPVDYVLPDDTFDSVEL
ncbi:uncharacterized protein LOC134824104 [Bolinopsis microptera]|uniref:uncharacterized protein LOC134824104 n=1 Tax=Bolinopsis microptera TaxID=2820187 RepID=UPI00307A7849